MGTTNRDEGWAEACRHFKALTVAAAERLMAVEPILAHPDETLAAVARKIVDHPEGRVVCVVDARGTLVGLLPIADLAFAAFVHVTPEVFLRHANDLTHSTQFASLSHGRTAGEVMRAPLALHPTDTLEDAVDRLLGAEIERLPIVDSANRVVGYLDLPEFLCAWLANCSPDRMEVSR